METQQPVTKKFIVGIVLIAVSLAAGKLVLIPIILLPGNEQWRVSMLIVYILSWVILLIGFYLCGIEGYRIVKRVYHDYQKKTMTTIKHHSKKAAQKTVEVIALKAKSGLEKMRKKPDSPQ